MASNKRISNSRFKENLPSAPDYMLGSDSLEDLKRYLSSGSRSHSKRADMLRQYAESNPHLSREIADIADQYKTLVGVRRKVKDKETVISSLDKIISDTYSKAYKITNADSFFVSPAPIEFNGDLSYNQNSVVSTKLSLAHTQTLDEIEYQAKLEREVRDNMRSLLREPTSVNSQSNTASYNAVGYLGTEQSELDVSQQLGVINASSLGRLSDINDKQPALPVSRRGGISTKLLGWKAIALAGTVAVAAGIGLYNFVTKGNNNSVSNQGLEQKVECAVEMGSKQTKKENKVDYVATPETVKAMVKAPLNPGFPFNPGFNLPFGIGQTKTEVPYTIPNTIRALQAQEVMPTIPEVKTEVDVKYVLPTEVGQMREIRDPVEVSGIIFDRSEVGQMTLVDDSKPFNGKETLQSVSNKKSLGDLADQYRTYSVNEGSRDAGISVRKAGNQFGEGLESLANAVTLSHATKKGNKYRQNDPKNIGQFFGNVFDSAGKVVKGVIDTGLYVGGGVYAAADLVTLDALPNPNKEYSDVKPLVRPFVLGARGVTSAGKTAIVHAPNTPTGNYADNVILPTLDATGEFLEAGKHLAQAAGNVTVRPAINLVTKNSERGNKLADYMFVVPTEWATNSVTGEGFTNLTKENIDTTAATKGELGAVLEFIGSGMGLGYSINELTSSSSGSSKGGITGGEDGGIGGN